MKRQVHLKISGRVQGVFFRAAACEEARKWGLKGWVSNTSDGGTVEAVAQGEENALKNFVTWCWDGPSAATVKNVEETWSDKLEDFTDFEIC